MEDRLLIDGKQLAGDDVARETSTPYVDALLAFAERDPARLVVPGHKGGLGADPALVDLVGEVALRHDVPVLIEGVDLGADAPFHRAQELAAEAWGARRTWFLVNGASGGNHVACLVIAHLSAARQAAEHQAGAAKADVVVQRSCHSSTIDGLILGGLLPAFVAPELDAELGIAHCMTPEALDRALDANPEALAVWAVSPSYFGAAGDVRGLAEVAHQRDLPLIVDEAWGAHLHFSDQLPEDALACGADLVISSTHKLVGSLTQSAMLHLGHGDRIDENVVDRCLTAIETTSPSGLLSGSLDAARRLASTHGEELLGEAIEELGRAREEIRTIPGLDVLDEGIIGRPGVHGFDPMRLSIDVREAGTTGYRLSEMLIEIGQVHLELTSENVLIAAMGLGEAPGPTLDRLIAALRTAIEQIDPGEQDRRGPPELPPPWGPLEMTPRAAFFGPQEPVPIETAESRVAAESLAAYPPGIPNVLPGERLTAETLDFIRQTLAKGGIVRGASDRTVQTIRVVKEVR